MDSIIYAFSTVLDFESRASYDFTVTVNDRGLRSHHNTPAGQAYIIVRDINDNDPVFDPMEYSKHIRMRHMCM